MLVFKNTDKCFREKPRAYQRVDEPRKESKESKSDDPVSDPVPEKYAPAMRKG